MDFPITFLYFSSNFSSQSPSLYDTINSSHTGPVGEKKKGIIGMITLEAQGPVKETELFVDLLCSFGFVKTYSQTYKNIEKTRALIVMEAGTPVSYFQNAPVDERFVSEDMIPDEPDQPTQ